MTREKTEKKDESEGKKKTKTEVKDAASEEKKTTDSEKLKKRSEEILKSLQEKSPEMRSSPQEEEEKKEDQEPKGVEEEKPKKVKAKKIKEPEASEEKAKVERPAPTFVPREPVKIYPLAEGITQARSLSKKRKFPQTWDLAIGLKGLNLKRPENRLNLEFTLPEGRGKEIKVGVIADSLASEAKKKGADLVITREEIPQLAKDKKRLKSLAAEVDWFYGEVTLMAEIGKTLGIVLGPRGKIPKPIPPKADVGQFIKRAKQMIKVAVKESPVIHVPIGSETMPDDAILRNLEAVLTFVKEKLPNGINSIRSIYLKLTMGKPVRLEVK